MEDKYATGDDKLDQDEKSKQKRKGHSKTSSISERDRKIGHRRINEEGQVCALYLFENSKSIFAMVAGVLQKNRDQSAYGLHTAWDP